MRNGEKKNAIFFLVHLGSSNNKQQTARGFCFLRFFSVFSPSIALLYFLKRFFGRLGTRRVQKRDKKIAEFFSQPPKKAATYLRHVTFFSFHGTPCI
jgi:hypothetical protein